MKCYGELKYTYNQTIKRRKGYVLRKFVYIVLDQAFDYVVEP